jgi:hypothetical protein
LPPLPIFYPPQPYVCISDKALPYPHGGFQPLRNTCIYRSKKSSNILKQHKNDSTADQQRLVKAGPSTTATTVIDQNGKILHIFIELPKKREVSQ